MTFTNSTICASYSVKTKQESTESHLVKVRVELVGHQEKIEAAVTISVTSVHLLVSKRESAQDSGEYNLAI